MSNNLARRISPYVGKLSTDHGPAVGAAVESRWAPIGPAFDDIGRKKASILAADGLSSKGKEQAVAELAAGDGAALRKRLLNLKETIRREGDELRGQENAAQVGLKPNPDMPGSYVRDGSARIEPTPENTILAVEIRAELRGMKDHEIRDSYLKAVADGTDPMLVFAVESCPSPRLALVDQDTLERAREIRISRSKLRDSIDAARASYDINSLLFEIAWGEFYTLIPVAGDDTPPLPQRRNVTLPFGVERVTQQLAS